jgi:amidophosphoribosyltransferase
MCGIIGVIGCRNIAKDAYTGLSRLDKRGQEGAGFTVSKDNNLYTFKGNGQLETAVPQPRLEQIAGSNQCFSIVTGHVRYRTAGGTESSTQPIVVETKYGSISVCHNGNMLSYYDRMRSILTERGEESIARDKEASDTKLFAHLIASSTAKDLDEAIEETLKLIKPTYSLIIQTADTLYAIRDYTGNRPITVGIKGENIGFASEEQALTEIGYRDVRDVEMGTITKIKIKQTRQASEYPYEITKKQFAEPEPHKCIWEIIYLANSLNREPDARPKMFGVPIRVARISSGIALARKEKTDVDYVVGVEGSGLYPAIGYSIESGKPLNIAALFKNPGQDLRTFIQPRNQIEETLIKKFGANRTEIRGKRFALTDDTIVRLNTLLWLTKLSRIYGAREIHYRIASPPTLWPCHYGIAMDERKQLIAAHMQKRMQDYIKGVENILRLRFFGLDGSKEELIEMAAQDLTQKNIGVLVEQTAREGKNFLFANGRKIRGITEFENFNPNRVSLVYLTLDELLEAYGINRNEYCLACFDGNYFAIDPAASAPDWLRKSLEI